MVQIKKKRDFLKNSFCRIFISQHSERLLSKINYLEPENEKGVISIQESVLTI